MFKPSPLKQYEPDVLSGTTLDEQEEERKRQERKKKEEERGSFKKT